MENVSRWLNTVDVALAEQKASAGASIYSNAWFELEKGALTNFAMDAASLAGQRGWFWVENPCHAMDFSTKNKRLAMRALCLADALALADIVPLLAAPIGVRAISSALNDPRVSHESAWDLIMKTWPLVLSLENPMMRPCQDWRPICALLTQCSMENCSRIHQVFEVLFGTSDTRGQFFSTTWLSSSCAQGEGLELCANVLRLWIDSNEPCNRSDLLLACRKALANGAADYLEKMSDVARGCPSLSYWRAWGKFVGLGLGDWHAWAKSLHRGIDRLSDNQKRSVGFSMIRDALDQFQREGAVFECDIFDEVMEIVMLLRKPWNGFLNQYGVAEKHYCLLAEESSVEWALEMGKSDVGWDRLVQGVNRIAPKAAATLSMKILARGTVDEEGKKREQTSEDRKSKRL